MKVEFLHEPELEFGVAKHIDIKFGLLNYGPLDFDSSLTPKKIKLGIVGTPESIEGITKWLEKCRTGIDAKMSKRPNLFPRFPGFGEGMKLCADFVVDNQLQRPISQSRFDELCRKERSNEVLKDIASLFLNELEYLAQKTTVDVLVCAFPFVLVEFLDRGEGDSLAETISEDTEEDAESFSSKLVLHDYLKANAMRFRRPTQIIRRYNANCVN